MTHIADGFTVEFHPDGLGVTLAVIGELDLMTAGVLPAQLERAIDLLNIDRCDDARGGRLFVQQR